MARASQMTASSQQYEEAQDQLPDQPRSRRPRPRWQPTSAGDQNKAPLKAAVNAYVTDGTAPPEPALLRQRVDVRRQQEYEDVAEGTCTAVANLHTAESHSTPRRTPPGRAVARSRGHHRQSAWRRAQARRRSRGAEPGTHIATLVQQQQQAEAAAAAQGSPAEPGGSSRQPLSAVHPAVGASPWQPGGTSVRAAAPSPAARAPCRRPRARSAYPTSGAPSRPGASGFDCSGLTAWAWGQAGVASRTIPAPRWPTPRRYRVTDLQPGDLLFYGPGGAEHVAMYVGGGSMIEAPYTGASVWITGRSGSAPLRRRRPAVAGLPASAPHRLLPAPPLPSAPASPAPPLPLRGPSPAAPGPAAAARSYLAGTGHEPIPVAFHIGPLEVHTYGIGLAITFWFGYRYFERRLQKNGYRTDWLVPVFLWVIVAAVVGARVLHVLSNLAYYRTNPGDVFAIWHGGLSSFGGILFAVPVGILLSRRRCPELPWPGPRPRRPRPDGRLGDGPAARAPADGGRRRPPDPPVVRHVLRRPGRPAATGADLPGPRGLHRLPPPDLRRAPLNRWPDGAPRSGYPPGTVLGAGWCSGASSGRSTSTSGSARTAASARCSSRSPGSRWPSAASPSWSSPDHAGGSGWSPTTPVRRPGGHTARERAEQPASLLVTRHGPASCAESRRSESIRPDGSIRPGGLPPRVAAPSLQRFSDNHGWARSGYSLASLSRTPTLTRRANLKASPDLTDMREGRCEHWPPSSRGLQ